MKNTSVYLLTFIASLWSVVIWAQQAATMAEPDAARAAVHSPGGIGSGINVPRLIKFSGTLTTPSGTPLTGVHGVTLALYKDQQGGSPIWLETQNVELDEQGRYTLLLGSMKSEGVPPELFSGDGPRWLGVQVLLPGYQEGARVLLVSVPYALKAADAETLGGKPLSAFVLLPQDGQANSSQVTDNSSTSATAAGGSRTARVLSPLAVSGTGATNQVVKWLDTNGTLGNSAITDSSGSVGVGTANPTQKLDVAGNLAVGYNTAGSSQVLKTFATGHSASNVPYQLDFTVIDGFFDSLGTGAGMSIRGVRDGSVNSQSVVFATHHGGVSAGDRVVIDKDGNVGIGTMNPVQMLDVTGNLSLGFNSAKSSQVVKTFASPQSASNVPYQLDFTAIDGFTDAQGTGAGMSIRGVRDGSANSQSIVFATHHGGVSAGDRVVIDKDGNMGVGTMNPGQKLDVTGNINSSGTVTATNFVGNGSGLTGITVSNTTSTFTGTPSGTGVSQGSLYVNPASASAGQTLMGLAVGGTQKLLVDSSGNLTTAGSISLPATSSSTVGILNSGGSPFLHAFSPNATYPNVFLGNASGNFTMTGYGNVGVGSGTLSSLQASGYNVAVGQSALSALTTASGGGIGNNTAVGAFALQNDVTATQNTAVGFQAMQANTGGFNQVAVGAFSMPSATTGTRNTASGALSLYGLSTGSDNVGIGYEAGASISTGSSNVAIGAGASGIQTGNYNTNVGSKAGSLAGEGSSNTFIGYNTGPGNLVLSGTLQNATAIGALAEVRASNSLVLGSIAGQNGATNSVNVGIGTPTPAKALDVVGDVQASGCVIASGTTIGGTCSSDLRLKKDVQAFPEVLTKLVQLQPVSFLWRNELPEYQFGSGQSMGLIAQDVEQLFPEMVSTDGRGYKQVNYSELPYLMLQSIRELKASKDQEIQELKKQVDELKKGQDVGELKKQIEELRALVAQMAAEKIAPK